MASLGGGPPRVSPFIGSQSTYAAKTYWVFSEDLFFGLHLLLNREPTEFLAKTFFFGLRLAETFVFFWSSLTEGRATEKGGRGVE